MVIVLNIAISWMLVGLIWVVQYTIYPAFRMVPVEDFPSYHRHHTASISKVVLPLMLAEVLLTGWLMYSTGYSLNSLLVTGLITLIWLSTFLVQVPLHQQLAKGKDLSLINRLVRTNWIRTILWTLKACWVSFAQFS